MLCAVPQHQASGATSPWELFSRLLHAGRACVGPVRDEPRATLRSPWPGAAGPQGRLCGTDLGLDLVLKATLRGRSSGLPSHLWETYFSVPGPALTIVGVLSATREQTPLPAGLKGPVTLSPCPSLYRNSVSSLRSVGRPIPL